MNFALKNKFVDKVLHDVLSAIIAGISLSFLFFIFSDFLFTTPNLNGKWLVEVEYEDTNLPRFQGLKVFYEVILIQKGHEINGTGEKVKDITIGKGERSYDGRNRVEITIQGYLDNNYLAKDELIIHYTEEGNLRNSSSFHDLVKFNEDYMSGNFASTIANSSGPTTWTRLFPAPKN